MYRWILFTILTLFVISCGDVNGSYQNELDSSSVKTDNLFIAGNSIDNNGVSQIEPIKLFTGYLETEYVYNLKTDANLYGKEYYVYSDNLPEGLELDEKTGIISGIPKKTGKYTLEIAVKPEEDAPLIIRPVNISIDDGILFYKDVRSFIDISKSIHSHTVNHNEVINLASNPAKNFFNFYKHGVNSIRVCKQGYLKLNGGSCSYSSDFVNSMVIAPFADPELTMGSDSKIYYQIRGLQPRRMLIVQFKNLHRTTDPNASQNFEVIIYESSDRITFLYSLSNSYSDNSQKHLGTNARIGLFSPNKQYVVSPEDAHTRPKPIIFDGTIITFKAPEGTATQYTKKLDGNLVADFIDIARYQEDAQDCTSDSQCRYTDKCVSGKCAARVLTVPLMYDNAERVDLPFSFNFFGETFTDIKVHENGYLFFDTENYRYYGEKPTPGHAFPVNRMSLDYVIAGLFSNIDLKAVRGGNILYNVVGQEPNRKAVFLYDKVRIIDPRTNDINICTFEIKLYEKSNIIEFIYGTNNKSAFCNGVASTVGIKKDSSDYVNIISNNPVLKQGKSIVFVPNDYLANTYTWVGVGNKFGNSVATSGISGRFQRVPFTWRLIDDQPANQFIRYDQTLTSNKWIDTSRGHRISLGDDDYKALPNPSHISFKFYGQPRTQYYVQSNGGLTIIPRVIHYSEPGNINYNSNNRWYVWPESGIFPYWNDINPRTGGQIRYLYTRRNNQNVVVVEWYNLHIYSRYGNVRFQVQMYENGQKYFCYKSINPPRWNRSHITGIRKAKNDNLGYTGDLGALARTGNCISYTPVYRYPPNHIHATRSTVSNQDAGVQNVPIGFTYTFMGNAFDKITISSNGIAKFENSLSGQLSGTNTHLSSSRAYDNSLALFWDDLDPRANNSPMSGIFYTTVGRAPNREFILSYNAVPHGRVSGNSRISAQLVLRENNPKILYCYNELSGSYSSGDSATIGIRKNISTYNELSYNRRFLSSRTCYEWTPPIPGYVEARNIYTGVTNNDFIDIPVEHPGFGEGIYLEKEYPYGDKELPYTIYDLTSQNYQFRFKGRVYNQLFVDARGAVSFGNDNDAAIITAPMWGDIFYQSDILNKSHISLQTPYENIENDFMWIANAGANSLSKINTHDGTVTGPFPVGSSPSRTAVGFDGSVWVGNRNSHNVTKLDRDGNRICTVNLNGGCAPRALALDKDENVWVGCGAWRNRAPDGWVYKIRDTHSETGPRCEILDIRAPGDHSSDRAFKGHSGYGHYGFAIDKHGILWSSPGTMRRDYNYFLRIDTNKSPSDAGFYKRFKGYSSNYTSDGHGGYIAHANSSRGGTPYYYYGIAIDYNGDLWLGNWGHTNRNRAITRAHYDPATDTLTFKSFHSYRNQYVSHARGVAIDANGYIYIAYSGSNNVGKFSPDGTAVALFSLNGNSGPGGRHNCTAPTGIGVDGDGDVWANCIRTSNSEELDANTGRELKSLPTGRSPYCYSDNTGFNLRNIVTDVKPAKYYAGITDFMAYPDEANCQYRYRKLIVEWRDVRIKTDTNYGYTEATFEMVFDNGYRYYCNDVTRVKSIHPVKIEFLYGAMQGNKFSQKSGGQSLITLKSINSDYNHTFGDQDAGTVNTGSKLVITSEK